MTAQAERDFEIKPVEHWYEISEGGRVVARLYKTFEQSNPYSVFMKVGEMKVRRFRTTDEAAHRMAAN